MAVPAAGSIFSIAPQASELGDVDTSTFNVNALSWYRFPVPRLSGGGVQQQQMYPQEIDGIIVPKGEYKSMAYFMKEFELLPRLENSIGWLLHAAVGNVSTVTGARWTPTGLVPATGQNVHVFRFNSSDSSYLPWMAVRTFIQGQTSSENFGEIGLDNKVRMFDLTVPSAGILTANVAVQGAKFWQPLAAAVNAWTYANAFESSESVPVSGGDSTGGGSVRIGTDTPPFLALQVSLNNNLATPQQEQIIGRYFPEGATNLFRALTMRATVKWRNANIWRRIYTGGTSNIDWSPLPWVSTTSGGTKAFLAEFYSPDVIPGTSRKYCIKIVADKVITAVDPNGIQLEAGDLIRFNVNINAHLPTSGDYVTIVLENNAPGYTWPV